MKGLKPTLVSAIAIGLLAGSAVGVAGQDDPESSDEQAASDSSEYNEYEQHAIVARQLWYCKKKNGKNVVLWDETRRGDFKKKECTETSLDTKAHIDIEATDAALVAGESVSAALESGDVNLLDSNPLLSSATADIFGPCRDAAGLATFVLDLVEQDAESGTTGTDESEWSNLSMSVGIVEAVEGVVAGCKEAIPR